MYLKKLSLSSVRNYRRLDIELGPGLNLFFGDNAQGKTNLLEAVYMLASLRSFRGVKAPALLSWGGNEGAIRGEAGTQNRTPTPVPPPVAGEGLRERGWSPRRLQVSLFKDGRQARLDGKRPGSAREYLLALRVASFSPEDLFLVKEYPSHRRRFLDRSVFHASPGYIDLAGRARAAVKQLNAALRAGDQKVVASYEEVLAPLAAEVTFMRRLRAGQLGPMAADLYGRVLGGGELGLEYRSSAKGEDRAALEKSYRNLLVKKRPDGLKRGICMVGPQSDDLVITLSGRDIKGSASRGQSRLAMLALVLADSGLYRQERGSWPVLLLDDVASELDERRKDALFGYIAGMGQVLLTSTDHAQINGRAGQKFKVTADGDGAHVVQA